MYILPKPIHSSIYGDMHDAYTGDMSFGANLRRLRAAAGHTQKSLSIALWGDDSHQNTISRWEKGRTSPSRAELLSVAAILGASLDELLRGENEHYDSARANALGTESAHLSSDAVAKIQGRVKELEARLVRYRDSVRRIGRVYAALSLLDGPERKGEPAREPKQRPRDDRRRSGGRDVGRN